MIWLAAAGLCCILVEVFDRLPLLQTARSIATVARKSIRVISSNAISDHWKEKAVTAYSLAMMKHTAMALGMLILFLGIVGIAIVAGRVVSLDLHAFLITWQGVVYSVLVAAVYAKVRRFRHA